MSEAEKKDRSLKLKDVILSENAAIHYVGGKDCYMTSFKYDAYNAAMRLIKVKRLLDKDGAAFDKMVEKFGKHQNTRGPSQKLRKKYEYQLEQIGGQPCYIVRAHAHRAKRAVLLFFGGGYFMPPDQGDFSFAGETAQRTESDVYLPIYPLAPKHKLTDTMKSVTDVFQEMLQYYEPGKIVFMGNSSGAALCLSMCLYIRHERLSIPFPDKLIMISPGLQMPPNEAQIKRMLEHENTDTVIPIVFCKNVHRALIDKSSAYLLQSFENPWDGFPEMIFFFGGCELFCAYVPDIEQAARAGKIKIRIHIGKNMMHCWPMLGFTKEAKQTRAEIYKMIREI